MSGRGRFGLWCCFILLSQTMQASAFLHGLLHRLTGMRESDARLFYEGSRNAYHVFLFGVFGWLLPPPRSKTGWTVAVALCVFVGVATEVLQFWVVNRSPEISDALLNVAASTAAFWWRSRNSSVAV